MPFLLLLFYLFIYCLWHTPHPVSYNQSEFVDHWLSGGHAQYWTKLWTGTHYLELLRWSATLHEWGQWHSWKVQCVLLVLSFPSAELNKTPKSEASVHKKENDTTKTNTFSLFSLLDMRTPWFRTLRYGWLCLMVWMHLRIEWFRCL